MDPFGHLVEQHVRESELHLRHVDDLFDRARRAAADPKDPMLQRLEAERQVLTQALEMLQRGPVGAEPAAEPHEGARLPGRLRALGAELERVLTAIGDRRGL